MDYVLRLITSTYYILGFFFIRSCIDETQLCKGYDLCPDQKDQKFCQNATSWGLTDANWKPISNQFSGSLLSCDYLDEQGDKQKNLQGQQINSPYVNDNRFFNCWNRKDEQPFDVAKTTNGTNDGNQKTWLDNVEKRCEQGPSYRRCLGDRADQCVDTRRKFL